MSKGLQSWISRTDWKSPTAILSIATVAMGFYAGGHYMKMGLFLGCAIALGILLILKKSPDFVQEWCHEHPTIADIVLSSAATILVSGFFGAGLTLGIGAVSSAVILSWAIPSMTKNFSERR